MDRFAAIWKPRGTGVRPSPPRPSPLVPGFVTFLTNFAKSPAPRRAILTGGYKK